MYITIIVLIITFYLELKCTDLWFMPWKELYKRMYTLRYNHHHCHHYIKGRRDLLRYWISKRIKSMWEETEKAKHQVGIKWIKANFACLCSLQLLAKCKSWFNLLLPQFSLSILFRRPIQEVNLPHPHYYWLIINSYYCLLQENTRLNQYLGDKIFVKTL